MKVSFSFNHDGDVLVLVNGKVVGLAKECEGFEFIESYFL